MTKGILAAFVLGTVFLYSYSGIDPDEILHDVSNDDSDIEHSDATKAVVAMSFKRGFLASVGLLTVVLVYHILKN